MRLDAEQREQFERDGYHFFPSLSSPREVAVLNEADGMPGSARVMSPEPLGGTKGGLR